MSTSVTGIGLALAGVRGPAELLHRTHGSGQAVDPAARLGARGLRYQDRASQLALCAAADLLRDAGLLAGAQLTVAGESVAVVVSSNFGNLDTVCEVSSAIAEAGTDGISPMALPRASSNVVASSVATRFGLRGPNLMLCNGATSGLDAVHFGMSLIAARRCERSLVIGVEPDNGVVRRLLGADDVFDGAAALLLESDEAARARGVRPGVLPGRYVRTGGSIRTCVDRVLADGPSPGIWVGSHQDGQQPASIASYTARHDMTTAFGMAGGALGVLQCAAAVGWINARGTGSALVTVGHDTDDAVAGMLLRRGEGQADER